MNEAHRVLDVCCGTGDSALEVASRAQCIACDFTWEMLVRAREKSKRHHSPFHLAAADALQLPFPPESFGAVTVAFGLRNLEDLNRGLAEILRVLRGGGILAVLEFTRPTAPLLRTAYFLYLHGLLPLIGRLVSRREGAYRYLANSISGFPDPGSLSRRLADTGYVDVSFRLLTGGIVAIHTGRKPRQAHAEANNR